MIIDETALLNVAALQAWLTDRVVLPGAPMAFEVYHALTRVSVTLQTWRPDECEWSSVLSVANDQLAARPELRGAHSSQLAPAHPHGLYGDFEWAIYSGLAAGYRRPDESIWSRVATLVVWPVLGPAILGIDVTQPSRSALEGLAAWLRESMKSPQLLRTMERLVGGCSTPSALRTHQPRLLDAHDRSLWRALAAHAESYCSSRFATATPAIDKDQESDEPGPPTSAIEKLISDAIADHPDNTGLAPEDCGAVRYRSRDCDSEDELSDPLLRHHVRWIASEREFNHLPLHWHALNVTECHALRNAISLRFTDSARRSGAVGLALCALLAMPPSQVARRRMHTTFSEAVTQVASEGVSLAWCDRQLVALQRVPRPPKSYRRPGDALQQAPHLPYVVIGVPDEIAVVLADEGAQEGGHLFRYFPDLATSTRELARAIRKQSVLRLHLGRIQRSVADAIYADTSDECMASLILPGARTPVGAGTYYSAIHAERAYSVHQKAATQVVPWPVPDCPESVAKAIGGHCLGSELLIPTGSLQAAVSELHARAVASTRLGRRAMPCIAAAHNLHTIYTVALLCLLTSHRPTHGPFPHPDDISPTQGLALIVDKRQDERTWHREVPLVEVAVKQVMSYRKSVAAVIGYLDDSHPQIAGALRSLSDFESAYPSAAAFSILDECGGEWVLRPVEPADWARYWPEWVWPRNGNRHYLMQALQEQGVRREAINYLFGHAEPGQTAFGVDAAIAPFQFHDEILPALGLIAASTGFKSLPPIRPYDRDVPKSVSITLPLPSFGDSAPARNRQHRLSSEERAACKRLLNDPSLNEVTDSERKDTVMRLVEAEFADRPSELPLVQALLLRWYRHHGEDKSRHARPPKQMIFTLQATPITRSELSDRQIGHEIRKDLVAATCAFLELQSEQSQAAPAEWLAHIYLSAIAIGGAHWPDFHNYMVEACQDDVYHRDGDLWLEWSTDRRKSRWVADPLTGQLLARFHQAFPAVSALPDRKAVRRAAGRVLKALPTFASSSRSNVNACRKRFSASIRALHRSFVPGSVMAHLRGHRHSTPVPRSSLLRAERARLVGVAPPDPTRRELNLAVPAAPPIARTDPILKAVRRAVQKAQGSSSTGGKATGTKGERLLGLRDDLNKLEAGLGTTTTVYQLVLLRLRDLVEHGGRLKDVLATSTIRAYMQPVIAFAASSIGKNVLSAEPEEIETAYRTLVQSGCASKAAERLASLDDFHQLGVEHFGLPPVDWGEIAADLPQCVKRIDANLIHPHEITAADALIQAAPGLQPDIALMARAVLHLMGDTGMRFGEVFRLRLVDVPSDMSFLFVRSTEHGEVKSLAGTRMVPLHCLLGDTGRTLLKALLERAEKIGNKDRLTALFCDSRDSRALVLRADIVRVLVHSLRLATGDPTLRPHHLRHSAVTRTYDLAVVRSDDSTWQLGAALRAALVTEDRPTRRAAHAHSQLFGHGGPDTTHIVYLHQQEFRAARILASHLPYLTSKQVATLTGISDAMVRKQWTAGSTTADLLRQATRSLLKERADLAAWRSIQHTHEPLDTTLSVETSRKTISLVELHRLLASFHVRELPIESLAALYGIAPRRVSLLIAKERETALELGFAPSMSRSGISTPWPGYCLRSPVGLKTPPRLAELPAVTRLDDLPTAGNNQHSAAICIRTFRPTGGWWEADTSAELSSLADWIATLGVAPRDVEIEMPCNQAVVPPDLRALAGPLSGAHFSAVAPRGKRSRGGESVRVHVRRKDNGGVATTLTHASFMWLVRCRAIDLPIPYPVPQESEAQTAGNPPS